LGANGLTSPLECAAWSVDPAAVEGKQCRFSIDRVLPEAFPADPDKAHAGYS
jgi:hypothetical protein